MARRRRHRSAKENPSGLVWALIGLGVVGAGVGIYVATRPKAAAATAATPAATPAAISAAQIKAALDAFNAQVNNQIMQPGDASTPDTSTGGGVNTGIPQIDNAANSATSSLNDATSSASDAVNNAASQLGF